MAIQAAIEASVKKTDTVTPAEGARAGSVVEKAVTADLVLQNAMNAEPTWQSGILWYGTGGVLWALGIIAVQVGTNGMAFQNYDYGVIVTALGALASAVGVLYRRFWPNLKPMWWRLTHKAK